MPLRQSPTKVVRQTRRPRPVCAESARPTSRLNARGPSILRSVFRFRARRLRENPILLEVHEQSPDGDLESVRSVPMRRRIAFPLPPERREPACQSREPLPTLQQSERDPAGSIQSQLRCQSRPRPEQTFRRISSRSYGACDPTFTAQARLERPPIVLGNAFGGKKWDRNLVVQLVLAVTLKL